MQHAASVVGSDQFTRLAGIEIMESRPGWAKARMRIGPQHLNGMGIVHGGAIFTLADYAFAVACNSGSHMAVAANANISYLKATRDGVLYAEAAEAGVEGRMDTCHVRVTNEAGELVAVFSGLAYRKGAVKA